MKNDHIVAAIHPFILQQQVAVYQDGVCTKIVKCSLDKVGDTIMGLSKEFDIQQVDLSDKSNAYREKIKEHLMDKYSTDNMNINVTIY